MSSEMLSAVFGFVGTILGSAITLVTQHFNNRAKRKALVAEHQVQEYLRTLDYACDATDALRAFGGALSGRTEPDANSTQEEIDESRRRDEEASKALAHLFDALGLLSRQAYRISAIGSRRIHTLASEVSESVDCYLRNAYERATIDRVFSANDFNAATAALQEKIKSLTCEIRSDLDIDRLFKAQSAIQARL